MKRLIVAVLALMLVFCLAACGGNPAVAETTADERITDQNGNEVSIETLEKLTEAYNAVATPYNEIATAANENGWMADAQTAAELDTMSATLSFIGVGLNEDLSMLDGTDFEQLIEMLESELPTALDILSERVETPYEG